MGQSGLFPFNPDRVLRDTTKPENTLDIPETCGSSTGLHPVDDAVPATPATPVTTETLLSVQALINKDANAFNEKSKRRLEKHVQKLTNAANISFAERELQKEHIRFLGKANNEAKVRRSTKSIVLGKAKMMKYEDLVEARVKRSEKERIAATKGKRGQKRKTEALKADSQEQRAPVARMI
jgi:hypothetical protein